MEAMEVLILTISGAAIILATIPFLIDWFKDRQYEAERKQREIDMFNDNLPVFIEGDRVSSKKEVEDFDYAEFWYDTPKPTVFTIKAVGKRNYLFSDGDREFSVPFYYSKFYVISKG